MFAPYGLMVLQSDQAVTRAPARRPAPSRADAGVRRGVTLLAATALVTLGAALVAAWSVGVPVRDPHGVTLNRFGVALGLALLLAAADAVVRAGRAARGRLPGPAAVAGALRARWTPARLLAAGAALLAFHLTYLGYRNLKSLEPLVRPGVLVDAALEASDRALAFGQQPAVVLHDVLGTGVAAQGLSTVYMTFFAFIPITLVGTLVLARDVRTGVFYASALVLNWLLAAGSYFVLPSLGPVYADPATFAGLHPTAVSALQDRLLEERTAFLAHPGAAGAAQSIGAFASLHMSIYFTAVMSAHVCGLGRLGKAVVWALTAATFVSTVYFGWHYVADAAGGLVIAAAAVAVSAWATAVPVPRRRPRAADPAMEPA
jgi:hypothetical protein